MGRGEQYTPVISADSGWETSLDRAHDHPGQIECLLHHDACVVLTRSRVQPFVLVGRMNPHESSLKPAYYNPVEFPLCLAWSALLLLSKVELDAGEHVLVQVDVVLWDAGRVTVPSGIEESLAQEVVVRAASRRDNGAPPIAVMTRSTSKQPRG